MKAVLVQCLLFAALVAASPGQTEMKANPQRPGTAHPKKQASAVSPSGKKTLEVRKLSKSRFEVFVSAGGNTRSLRWVWNGDTTGEPKLECGWEDETHFWIIIDNVVGHYEWRDGGWRATLESQRAGPQDRPTVRPMPSPSPDLPSKVLPSPPVDPSPGEYFKKEQPG